MKEDEIFEQEWQKMLRGEVYAAAHPGFARRLEAVRELLWEYNGLPPSAKGRRWEIMSGLLGSCGERCHINQPFHCDFGCNIHVGSDFFANFNLTILDEAEVRIGSHVFVGPNVSMYTACHPLSPSERNTGVEWARPIRIGDNVWIGGSATILPGVSIGDNAVVGAGSVVTRDVEPGIVVAGNPARMIRTVGA